MRELRSWAFCRHRPSLLRHKAAPASAAPPRSQSYTSSPADPQARLFYNPAFNDDTITRMSDSKSVIRWGGRGPGQGCQWQCGGRRVPGLPAAWGLTAKRLQPLPRSASHIPRPGYTMRSQSARLSVGRSAAGSQAAAPQAEAPAQRRGREVSQSLDSLDSQARQEKLQKLRAAVEALETDAAEGRLGSGKRSVRRRGCVAGHTAWARHAA